jgi:AAA domain, putative AbiEii toxin, Type IV TA system
LFYNDGNSVERNELFVTKTNYNLQYVLDGIEYKIIKTGWTGLSYEKNGKKANPGDIKLPSALICIAYNISDKFPVTFSSPLLSRKDRYDNDFYSYLGIKVHRNSATPTGHIYRTLDLITSEDLNSKFQENASLIFDFLNLKPQIVISYKMASLSYLKGFFTGGLTVEDFINIVESSSLRSAMGYSYNTFQKLIANERHLLTPFVDYLNKISQRKRELTELVFDFSKNTIISKKNKEEYKFLNLARKLKIINYKDIILENTNGIRFSFKDSSSGQNHMLTSILSLASIIRENSIVLIDEPETSLHPNWQMKYFDLLYKVFKQYKSCHFIVASHSHFLASDLRPDTSSILALKRNIDYKLESKVIPRGTFGWSAEQVLLEVFNTPTTRNLFVSDLVGNIINMIANPNKDEEKIRKEVDKLFVYNLDKLDSSDPLKAVIDKLIKKYGKI